MEKDKIFFGESGLTSTSANFIANLAKEAYRKEADEVSSIQLFNVDIKLIGSAESSRLHSGLTSLADFKAKLEYIAGLKSLIAWLREAIKAKNNLMAEANKADAMDFGIELPVPPVKKETVTADEVIATWSIKQRNRYFYLDTICSVIGTQIHPDGPLSEARKEFNKALREPYSLSGTGRDAVIFTNTPSLPQSEVEDVYMELQATYRQYQAELNSMKHQIEQVVQADDAQKSADYKLELEEYSSKMSVISHEVYMKRQQLVTETQALKIIIPDSLKDTYQKVSRLGKKD